MLNLICKRYIFTIENNFNTTHSTYGLYAASFNMCTMFTHNFMYVTFKMEKLQAAKLSNYIDQCHTNQICKYLTIQNETLPSVPCRINALKRCLVTLSYSNCTLMDQYYHPIPVNDKNVVSNKHLKMVSF